MFEMADPESVLRAATPDPSTEPLPSELNSLVARTTGSEGPFCIECGRPVEGRRRNGFCSDACRMSVRRRRERERLDYLLSTLQAVTTELTARFLSRGSR